MSNLPLMQSPLQGVQVPCADYTWDNVFTISYFILLYLDKEGSHTSTYCIAFTWTTSQSGMVKDS